MPHRTRRHHCGCTRPQRPGPRTNETVRHLRGLQLQAAPSMVWRCQPAAVGSDLGRVPAICSVKAAAWAAGRAPGRCQAEGRGQFGRGHRRRRCRRRRRKTRVTRLGSKDPVEDVLSLGIEPSPLSAVVTPVHGRIPHWPEYKTQICAPMVKHIARSATGRLLFCHHRCHRLCHQ